MNDNNYEISIKKKPFKDKKTILILIGIAIPIIIVSLILSLIKGPPKTLDINDVIDIDYNNTKLFKLKKSDVSMADKYNFSEKGYIANKTIKIGDLDANLYVINDQEVNGILFQSKYTVISNEEKREDILPPLIQVNEYMNEFKMNALTTITSDINMEPTEEKLYGESKYDFPLPTEESIYVEKRLYSLTYKIDNHNYDMNFYMANEDTLICELLKY